MKIKLKSFDIERKRRIESIKVFDKRALEEWHKILNNKNLKKFKNQLQIYFNFLKNLEYNHHNIKHIFHTL